MIPNRLEFTIDAMQDKLQEAFEFFRRDIIATAEAKLDRSLTADERSGIHRINSWMMLESVSNSFASPDYTAEQILGTVQFFAKQET